MKTIQLLFIAMFVSFITMAQTYSGTSWKDGGWKFSSDNAKNLDASNIIEAYMYDKGTYMPVPADLAAVENNVAAFKASSFAAGVIKAPNVPADETCAGIGQRQTWDFSSGTMLPGILRKAFLNKRKGDNTSRNATECPTVIPGSINLDAGDPAASADPAIVSAVCMNDCYGRLSASGIAARYSIDFEPGLYSFLFKGNAAQAVKVRILKRDATNNLTEVYSGVSSATGADQNFLQITTTVNADYSNALVPGFEKILDHMKIYASGACQFSKQKKYVEGVSTSELLQLNLSGKYVLEIISDGGSGAAGAFTFYYEGAYTSAKNTLIKSDANVYFSNNQINVESSEFKNATVSVYDMSGKLVESKARINNNCFFDMNNNPKGVYLVRISNGNKIENKKIQVY